MIAGRVAVASAVLWAIAFYGLWDWMDGDTLTRVYDWPGASLLTFSIAGQVAWALAVGSFFLLSLVWKSAEGWAVGRKVRHTFVVTCFTIFGLLVAAWGGFTLACGAHERQAAPEFGHAGALAVRFGWPGPSLIPARTTYPSRPA